MSRIIQVSEGRDDSTGFTVLLEDGRWFNVWYRAPDRRVTDELKVEDVGASGWQWQELPQPPAPERTPELETGDPKEQGTPDYSITLHAFLNAPGHVRVTAWPTIVALLKRELEAEVKYGAVLGSRMTTKREGVAYSRGDFNGLRSAATSIRAVLSHVSRDRVPDAVQGVLLEVVTALEKMAVDASP